MSFSKNRFIKEGAGLPPPQKGWPRLGSMFLTHFWKLIGANLLFILFSVPVITLPAALCALDRVCVLIYRDGNLFLWRDYWQEFRRSFLRSLLPGLFFAFMIFGAYFFLSLASGNAQNTLWFMIFWAVGVLMLLAAVCVGAYFFVLAATLELNNRDALKDALILVLAKPGRAVLVLLIAVGSGFVMAALLPIGVILLVVCWFSFLQYLICFLIFDLAEEMILRPYEAGREARESRSGTE